MPRLRQKLSVSRASPGRGDPVGLVGGEQLLCALQHGAPTACIGETGLALEPVEGSANDGRYEWGHAELPVAIEGIDLRHLDVAGYHRCVHEPGQAPVRCWWKKGSSRSEYLPELLGFGLAKDVAAAEQTCIVDGEDVLRCRGSRTCFGREDLDTPSNPRRVIDVPGIDKARLVDKSIHMGRVVRLVSKVACWGSTHEGDGCTPDASVVPELQDVVEIAVETYSACALRADNRVLCWGDNSGGTLGREEPGTSSAALEVVLAHPAVELRTEARGTAALRVDGSVVAWWRGGVGQGSRWLGEGAAPSRGVLSPRGRLRRFGWNGLRAARL